MNKAKTLYNLFIFLTAITIDNISCANFSPIRNAIWPYIDSIPFPYPTTDPINITSSQALPVFTPFPLQFINNPLQQVIIKNTGSELVVTSSQPQLANITGGVLFGDLYTFIRCIFYWDNSLSGSAAEYINGKGISLIVSSDYYNTKYGNYDNAKKKRNGIVKTAFRVNVLDGIDNVLFYPFQSALQQVLKAGSSTTFSAFLEYDWYIFSPSFTKYYYAYPGNYQDPVSGKVFNSSTNLLIIRTPRVSISLKQFKATFGSLKNKAGKPYSNIITKIYTKGQRPLRVAYGYTTKFVL